MSTLELDFTSDELAVWLDGEGDVAAVRDAAGVVYTVQELAGTGATGAVFKVTDPEDRVFAMKMLRRGKYAKAEIRALKLLRHPNVVRFEGAASDRKYPHAFLFFEYIDGGQLCDMTPEGELCGGLWTEKEVRRVALDLAASVAHLHQNDVVHRDIKPQNCLRRRTGQVVLADFGASELPDEGDDLTRRTVGTPFFYPPEACTGKCFGSKGQDVWALGVTLYLLLFGRVPFGFGARGVLQLSMRLESDELELDVPGVSLSSECREFLQNTLEKDMTRRLGLRDIVHHRWLTGKGSPQTSLYSVLSSVSITDSLVATYKRTSNDGLQCFLTPRTRTTESLNIEANDDKSAKGSCSPSPKMNNPLDSVNTTDNYEEGPCTISVDDYDLMKRVLVAVGDAQERNHLVRRIEAVTVEKEGLIDTCGDAVVSQASRGYAAVFFPMHLFPMDAVEVARTIRAQEDESGTARRTVLVVVARTVTTEQREQVLAAGADEVMLMPTRLGELRRVLRAAGCATKDREHVDRSTVYDAKVAYDSQCRARDDTSPMSPASPSGEHPVLKTPLPPTCSRAPSFQRSYSYVAESDVGLTPGKCRLPPAVGKQKTTNETEPDVDLTSAASLAEAKTAKSTTALTVDSVSLLPPPVWAPLKNNIEVLAAPAGSVIDSTPKDTTRQDEHSMFVSRLLQAVRRRRDSE
eukprot:Hpha_TRINITY_DN16534_c3_g1::TRINITY_DN16534_c3_g1_i8::g.133661::m.133661/K07359/CAMKK2; calcium/calmodulin-dependent protein kinase kinase 2